MLARISSAVLVQMKGFGAFIVHVQIFVDGGLQLFDTAKDSTAYAFVRDFCEPSFHQVDPGTIGGGKVNMKSWAFREPFPDDRGFVGKGDVGAADVQRTQAADGVGEVGGRDLEGDVAGVELEGFEGSVVHRGGE